MVTQGFAEIAPYRALEEAQVLLGQGVVKARLLAEPLDIFCRRVWRHHQTRRIAREITEREYDKGDNDYDKNG